METTLTTPEETAAPTVTEPVVDPLEERAPTGGGIRVSTSSMTHQWAGDGNYSTELALWMESMPGQDLQQSLDRLEGKSFDVGPRSQTATDKTLQPMRSDGSGESLGVLIANAHYEHLDDLPGPIAETRALAGQLSGRGYESTVKTDLSASEMLSEFRAPLSDPRLSEQDQVMLYYSGHGTTAGILGVESQNLKVGKAPIDPEAGEDLGTEPKQVGSTDLISAGMLLGIARQISAEGADVNLVLDCCHSGGMNTLIGNGTRREEAREAVSCLDEAGADRFREALKPFSKIFFRFRQTSEQKAAIDAATASTEAAIEVNSDALQEARAALSEHEERIKTDGGMLTDAMVHAVLTQKAADLLAERYRLLEQKKAETDAVIIGWWVEGYPALEELLAVFAAETGTTLTAPMASPQTAADLAAARSQLYVILGALGDRLTELKG